MTTFTFAVSRAAQAKIEKAAEKFKAQLRQIVTADAEKPIIVEHVNLHVFSNLKSDSEDRGNNATQKRKPRQSDSLESLQVVGG